MISSRFAPEKKNAIALCWEGCVQAGLNTQVKLVVTGLSDSPESDEFRRMVSDSDQSEFVILESFSDRKRLAALFHAADLALFARPSISCQEALGTGAYGVFADDGSMNWLLPTADLGETFTTGSPSALADTIRRRVRVERVMDNRELERATRAQSAAFLDYDTVIDTVIDAVYHSGT